MVSGMTMMIRYPLAAATEARPMPVLPEVGSIITESASFFRASALPNRPSEVNGWNLQQEVPASWLVLQLVEKRPDLEGTRQAAKCSIDK